MFEYTLTPISQWLATLDTDLGILILTLHDAKQRWGQPRYLASFDLAKIWQRCRRNSVNLFNTEAAASPKRAPRIAPYVMRSAPPDATDVLSSALAPAQPHWMSAVPRRPPFHTCRGRPCAHCAPATQKCDATSRTLEGLWANKATVRILAHSKRSHSAQQRLVVPIVVRNMWLTGRSRITFHALERTWLCMKRDDSL